MRMGLTCLCLCAVVGWVGCASVPQYRPVFDLSSNHRVEVGFVPQAGLGVSSIDRSPTGALPGVNGYVITRVSSELDLFAAGHGGLGLSLPEGAFAGGQYGGSFGVRFRLPQDYLPDMRFAFEAMGDYLEEDLHFAAGGKMIRRHLSGIVRLPVAQRASDRVWVYTAPTLGLALPLYAEAPYPFFGLNEIPLGCVATVHENLSVVAEGGYLIPANGGYLGVGLILHL